MRATPLRQLGGTPVYRPGHWDDEAREDRITEEEKEQEAKAKARAARKRTATGAAGGILKQRKQSAQPRAARKRTATVVAGGLLKHSKRSAHKQQLADAEARRKQRRLADEEARQAQTQLLGRQKREQSAQLLKDCHGVENSCYMAACVQAKAPPACIVLKRKGRGSEQNCSR